MYTRMHRLMYMVLTVVLLGARLGLGVEVGEPAPDFTLPSSTGNTISLSQFKDKKHVLTTFHRI